MPAVISPVRDRSDVGRFPTVTFPFVEDVEEEKEEPGANDVKKENACQQWWRKACACCYKQPGDDDVTETVVTEAEDPDKGEEGNGEKPTTGEGNLNELLLTVKSIDLMKRKTEHNLQEHHTDLYQSDKLIIRRGQTFQMWITLSRPFDPLTDKLHLELKTGLLPEVSKGTHVIVPLVEDLEDGRWEATVVKQEDRRLKLSVNSPPTAVIGRYQLTVGTSCANGPYTSTRDPANDIYMLFNPWCDDDLVYMDSEAERQECVLNDVGRIYYGTEHQIGERTWDYGQFSDGILAVCVFLLEKSRTPNSGWGDPVNVVRILSAMVNSPDDLGVLEGRWDGNYSLGTAPTVWSGSVEILQEYYKNKGTPVKYGQCWVFAGVFTTVLRCLGIPARTVTNFSSAHDTDVSLTTDVYLDENFEPITHLNADSTWNFHVWTDCWMARPDLPHGYGGWQTVDATPQETSQGTYCCGPASLTAVRNGQVYLKHDSPFVFAEVNSDKIYWQKTTDGTFRQIYSEKNIVGHAISTKAVGSDERLDITHLYKHPEGSEEERIAVETACSYGSKAAAFPSPTTEDVTLEVFLEGDGPKMGEDAELTIKLRNKSSEQRNITLHSQLAVMYYTGVHKATVKRDKADVEILPNEENELTWAMEYKMYKDQLIDQGALMLTLSGRVRETQQVLVTQFSFRLRTPDLIIKPIGKAVVGKEMKVEISFTNPLPRVLKEVIFHIEGLGLLPARKIEFGNIGSQESVSVAQHFVPSLPGPRKLLASLDSKQLTQVHGVCDINVEDKSSVDS
ncbi:protein-glutamine gamma-glutamyltransferase K isoform X1 [Fundulus heteroclitus]|uniref:protein-glutamine gamma-glutamyltransferase K isoform X1 n=1 Tax=Fundulus heteroclitus TaxID=8078 RepID=UPI00165CB8A6|nr:protein-glutamine gamma-glutamyltransferase K isoform X1 [Fundulus heteroclitus]XP_035997360.1 protein-glutamine gamma-glutamyltransferase K isoform X1 [Fundulus heteroclitus]